MATTNRHGSVVGESVSITGRVTGDGDLEVRGRIDGEVDIRGELVIADGAMIRASLVGARVTIAGAVLGDVSASDAIVLEASARVVGNLRAPRIAIASGAQIRGDLDMGQVDLGEAAAPVRATAARPAAAPRAARAPLPPARPVVVQRKNPPPQGGVSAMPAPPPSAPPVRRPPPEPVVPAIKKGAKAAAKKKA